MCEVISRVAQGLATTVNEVLESGEGGIKVHSTSDQIVLTCAGCGEKIVLLGIEEDWRSRHAIFRCECGQKLDVDGRADEEVLAAS